MGSISAINPVTKENTIFIAYQGNPSCTTVNPVHIVVQWNLSQQTPRIKDTIEKTSIIRTKILVPTGLVNTVFTSERGKLLYYSKKWPKILGPKMSVMERFHCMPKGTYWAEATSNSN